MRKKQLMYMVSRGVLLGLVLGIAFAGGYLFHDITVDETVESAAAQADPVLQPEPFTLLQEVHGLVQDNFYREPPERTELEYAAIRGYLGALNDPYSFFNDPPVAQSESDALAGIYGGIGVTIKRNVAGQIEIYPYPNGPAARAGVVNGDILMAINGSPIDPSERVDVVRQALRGEVVEDNGVEITVLHDDESRSYFIAFEEILVPSTLWRMLPSEAPLGYIQITSFTARTPEEFEQAVRELRDQGMVGLVLDLRDNYGGLLRESIDLAGEFLDGGIIIIEKSRQRGEQPEEDSVGGAVTDLPVVVITNERTASAAEVVAGALQQNDRAIVVGQRTRGKGSVQFIFGLADGSSVRMTAEIWLTPDGTPLDGVGLVPDIEMIPDETGRDVELDEAIRQLEQRIEA